MCEVPSTASGGPGLVDFDRGGSVEDRAFQGECAERGAAVLAVVGYVDSLTPLGTARQARAFSLAFV